MPAGWASAQPQVMLFKWSPCSAAPHTPDFQRIWASEQVPLASHYYYGAPTPTYVPDPRTSKALQKFTPDERLVPPLLPTDHCFPTWVKWWVGAGWDQGHGSFCPRALSWLPGQRPGEVSTNWSSAFTRGYVCKGHASSSLASSCQCPCFAFQPLLRHRACWK